VLEGALQKMSAVPGNPAAFSLRLRAGIEPDADGQSLDLNSRLGQSLDIEYLGSISCSHCGRSTKKSYAQGHCFVCFRKLARCDLCVMSPDRCHFAAGTCREPEWGEAFCMQPHLVYRANSSGPKVGITRAGHETGRWLDQGASQGLVILSAPTRHMAGLAEVALARHVPDRTDWRALVRQDASPIDLLALRAQLRARVRDLPPAVTWLDGAEPETLSYPVLGYPPTQKRFRLEHEPRVRGRLLGIKGQFLLFDGGVFNVRQHSAFHVRVRCGAGHSGSATDHQMELFSR
jgi:hypothetical protein